jgi:hypothetical protein
VGRSRGGRIDRFVCWPGRQSHWGRPGSSYWRNCGQRSCARCVGFLLRVTRAVVIVQRSAVNSLLTLLGGAASLSLVVWTVHDPHLGTLTPPWLRESAGMLGVVLALAYLLLVTDRVTFSDAGADVHSILLGTAHYARGETTVDSSPVPAIRGSSRLRWTLTPVGGGKPKRLVSESVFAADDLPNLRQYLNRLTSTSRQ